MTQQFNVTGMTCGHCEMAVKRAIKEIDPLAEITVERAANRVTVESDKDRQAIVKAITEEGYHVEA